MARNYEPILVYAEDKDGYVTYAVQEINVSLLNSRCRDIVMLTENNEINSWHERWDDHYDSWLVEDLNDVIDHRTYVLELMGVEL